MQHRSQQPQQTLSERVGGRLPSYDSINWAKTALELLVLLIALPWLLRELFHNPGKLSERMAGHHALS